MEENKNPKPETKEKKDKQPKVDKKPGISEWFNGITGEFKRITWPNRAELVKMVVTVIITSGVFGGIIVLYDFLLAAGYDGLYSFINNLG